MKLSPELVRAFGEIERYYSQQENRQKLIENLVPQAWSYFYELSPHNDPKGFFSYPEFRLIYLKILEFFEDKRFISFEENQALADKISKETIENQVALFWATISVHILDDFHNHLLDDEMGCLLMLNFSLATEFVFDSVSLYRIIPELLLYILRGNRHSDPRYN